MPRDYKYRAQDGRHPVHGRRQKPNDGLSVWQWMLITAAIIGFVVLLFYLVSRVTKSGTPAAAQQPTEAAAKPAEASAKPAEKPRLKVEAVPRPEGPQFDFYTYLPKKEIVVPDYEINTRTREERVGKAKLARYALLAGSFREAGEAENLRANLAAMGIEARIERAKVGSLTWHRVSIGPYTRMASVSVIRSRLRQNGIDAVVTEIGQ